MAYFGALKTPGGFTNADVASALQKAVRRGDEFGALFWATELEIAGYGEYVWNRLRIIASEDIGLADPQTVILVRALYDNWLQRVTKEKASAKAAAKGSGRPLPRESVLYLLHAVSAMARARKHRGVDHAVMLFYEGNREQIAPSDVPDYALDNHTPRGKKLGRGPEFFLSESARLTNEASEIDDPFRQPGHTAHLATAHPRDFQPVDIHAHNQTPTSEQTEQLILDQLEKS